MTIVQFLQAIIHTLAGFGAHHAYSTRQGHNGLVATHHWLAVVCHIPARHAAHAIFHCSGWVRL